MVVRVEAMEARLPRPSTFVGVGTKPRLSAYPRMQLSGEFGARGRVKTSSPILETIDSTIKIMVQEFDESDSDRSEQSHHYDTVGVHVQVVHKKLVDSGNMKNNSQSPLDNIVVGMPILSTSHAVMQKGREINSGVSVEAGEVQGMLTSIIGD
ncbi:hypothetical protein TSUD_212860 [Trifolium subterraneum]|uniref:Uncharacterized protein n=1 Tax=Trifolium subterraneum TaxID=3900 RepID=A0A2Z6N3N4_TRISU|nr:hypothetical protein TSUD_212860 [Trifolium subterraneum]